MKSNLLLFLLIFSSTGLLKAQDRITLQQAIDLGIKNNPSLKVSSAKIKIAQSRLSQSEEMRLPHAGASIAYSHYEILTPFALKFGGSPKPLFVLPSQGFDATIGSASISQDIFAGFRTKSAIKSSEYLLQAAKLDAEKDKTDLAYTIASAYYNIYKIIKSEEIIDVNLKALDEKIRELNSLEKNGLALHNDVLKVSLQKTNLEMSRMDVDNAKTTALYAFAIITGLPENTPYTIDTTALFGTNPELAIGDLQNQAVTTREELRSNSFKLKAWNENVNSLKAAYYPSLGVALNYYLINPGSNFIPQKDAFLNAAGVGVNLAYSISSLWEKGKLDEARANIAQINAVNELQESQIKSEVFTNYNSWKVSNDKIALIQDAITQAAENYRTTNSRYTNNIATMTELMDANTMLLQAQLNKINALADAKLAYIKLMYSVGK
jgi:outer membrane protein TolC